MKINLVTAWYDVWVGAYYDKRRHRLYVLPVPCIGVVIDLPSSWRLRALAAEARQRTREAACRVLGHSKGYWYGPGHPRDWICTRCRYKDVDLLPTQRRCADCGRIISYGSPIPDFADPSGWYHERHLYGAEIHPAVPA